MKKLLAILLTLTLVLGISTVAFAETTSAGPTLDKEYARTNPNTTSPAETFAFTIAPLSVAHAAAGITTANMPVPTLGTATFEAGGAGTTVPFDVTLPDYSSVGIYKYTIQETAGNTAGVTYAAAPLTLTVTVTQGEDGLETHTNINTTGSDKISKITNTYSAGALTVSKEVTGNLGDRQKAFDITVTFTAPAGKEVKESITYGNGQSIAPSAWANGTATATISLKHGESISFANIPYGVTYSVVEADYTSEGYQQAVYTTSDEHTTIDTVEDTVMITNHKEAGIDTGISLDNISYILMLVLVAGFGILFFARKRRI